jgi:hypothetical protein
MSQHEASLYALAENLGMLVSDIKARMSLREYHGWLQYHREKNEARQEADNPLKSGDAMLKAFGL